jgi:hypothetical protein
MNAHAPQRFDVNLRDRPPLLLGQAQSGTTVHVVPTHPGRKIVRVLFQGEDAPFQIN